IFLSFAGYGVRSAPASNRRKPLATNLIETFDVGFERDGVFGRKERSTRPRGLFPFERVFEAADGVLNLALYLVGLAIRLQLGIAKHLARDLLDFPFDFLRRSLDPVLVHDFFLQY